MQACRPGLHLFIGGDIDDFEVVTFGAFRAELLDGFLIASAAEDRVAQGNEFLSHRPAQAARDSGDHNDFLFCFVVVHN